MEPVRGQAIELEHPAPACVVHFSHAGSGSAYYLVPRPGGRIWVGSTVEEGGYEDSTTPHGLAELLVAARSVLPGIGVEVIVLAFAVVVIGGMGSIMGALIGSGIVGITRAWAVHQLPEVELFVIYAIMAVVLAVRPQGLFAPVQARKI